MQLLSNTEKTLLKIGRSVSDLRLGLPVSVNNSYLFIPVETLNLQLYEKLALMNKTMCLVMSAEKAAFITKEDSNSEKLVFFDQSDCTFEDIKLSEQNILKNHNMLSNNAFDIESAEVAVQLTKIAEILPTLLMLKVNCDEEKLEEIINITHQDLAEYLLNVNQKISLVAQANLNLKHAKSAKILSFRPNFIGQEHYAIIIGDLSKVQVPMVRIHSSCYTGDLMASLSCDCRDQLLDTVARMSEKEENAGIILYMMQEGRGVGLTNKIRAYTLQEEGYDTVEANHFLGFDDDERSFDAAASILKELNITEINLLTNNPIKREAMKSHGIKISKTISLFGYANKYNEAYLSTKKDKMGHEF